MWLHSLCCAELAFVINTSPGIVCVEHLNLWIHGAVHDIPKQQGLMHKRNAVLALIFLDAANNNLEGT